MVIVLIKPDGLQDRFNFSESKGEAAIMQTCFGLYFKPSALPIFLMSLIRMVIYLQSFFSQYNIPQTSVAHI